MWDSVFTGLVPCENVQDLLGLYMSDGARMMPTDGVELKNHELVLDGILKIQGLCISR